MGLFFVVGIFLSTTKVSLQCGILEYFMNDVDFSYDFRIDKKLVHLTIIPDELTDYHELMFASI